MCLLGIVTFALIRVKKLARAARPQVPLRGLAPRRRLAGPVHDLQRHLDDVPVPRRRGRRRQLALRRRRLRLDRRSATCSTARTTLELLEGVGLLLHIGVMLVFLVIVLHSKHLHIFVAPLNVLFGRQPAALGAVKPLMVDGKPFTLDDVDDLDEDAKLGIGIDRGLHLEGHARLRDLHRVRSLPVAVPGLEHREAALAQDADHEACATTRSRRRRTSWPAEDERDALPAAARQGGRAPARRRDRGRRLAPDRRRGHRPRRAVVLRHLRRLRQPVPGRHRARRPHHRHAPLPGAGRVELPGRAQRSLQGPGEQGQPVEHVRHRPLDWAKDLPFEVKVVGEDVESLDEVEWLFWVGCAGAYEDRAKKTTARRGRAARHGRRVASPYSATARPAPATPPAAPATSSSSRALAQQNVETFKEHKVKKVVSTCAALLQHPEERVRGVRHRARGRAPHPAAQPAGARGQADPGRRGRRCREAVDHLPRPVLHRPPQPGLHAAA